MEVQWEPALQANLDQITHESGRAAADLVHDAVAGYVDELAETRRILDSRYDDIKSGKVKLIPGDEVASVLREKSARVTFQPWMTGYDFHPEARKDLDEIRDTLAGTAWKPPTAQLSRYSRHSDHGSFSSQRTSSRRSYQPSLALHSRAGLSHRLGSR